MRIDKDTLATPRSTVYCNHAQGLCKRRYSGHVLSQSQITGCMSGEDRYANSRGKADLHRCGLTDVPIGTDQPKKIGRADGVQVSVLDEPYRSHAVACHE